MNYLALAVFLTGAVLGAAGAAKVEETDALGVMGLVPCLEAARPGSCLKARTTRLVENWLIAQDEKEELTGGTREGRSEGQDDTLPEGLPPFVQRLVDSLVNRLSRLFTGGKDDEEEDAEEPTAPKSGPEKEGQRNQVEARGKKKKIKRAIKKAIIKLIIIALLIKHKIKMLLMAFQTFLLFKFVLLAGIYVVATIFKVWAEIKHKHHPQKVIYYENAHHQHHYDHDNDHYDDHGWTGGLWGRSMVVPDMSGDTTHQTQPQSAHYDAYSAHVPKHN